MTEQECKLIINPSSHASCFRINPPKPLLYPPTPVFPTDISGWRGQAVLEKRRRAATRPPLHCMNLCLVPRPSRPLLYCLTGRSNHDPQQLTLLHRSASAPFRRPESKS